MNLSRSRQFGDYRSQHNSKYSDASSLRNSQVSMSSTPSEACYNCVNTILAQRKKQQQKKEKQQSRNYMRNSIKALNSLKDPQSQHRRQLKKQIILCNSTLIEQHKKAHQQQVEQDRHYAQQIKRQVEQAEQNYKAQIQEQKNRQHQFHKQLRTQYIQAIDHKDKTKFAPIQNGYPQGLPLYNPSKKQQTIEYQNQLKNQIQQKQRQQEDLKSAQIRLQQQKLQQFEKQAQKYHSDKMQLGQHKNPYLQTQIQQIQQSRQVEQKKQKQLQNQQKLQNIRQDNQLKSRVMKQKMADMQKYVEQLKGQMLNKQSRIRQARFRQQQHVDAVYRSQQQMIKDAMINKECKGCHKEYPQQYIGKVPKKL